MPASPVTRVLLSLLLIALAILLTFGPVLRNDFVNFDDQKEIIENPDFNPVTLNKLAWNWTNTRLTLYMPITYMVWGAVATIAPRHADGTLAPMAFHALSLLLHVICSGLVYLLILQLFHRIWPALAGALVFAIHPLQTEAVAWASGMYTLLSTELSVAALMAYIAYATRFKNRPMIFFALATIVYALALLTKAASVAVPLAAAIIDLFIIGRPMMKVIKSLLLWGFMGIPIVIIAKYFQDVSMLPTPPLWGRPVIALDAIGFYLRKIVLPIDLIPDYGRNPNWVLQHLPAAAISIGAASIALIIALLAHKKAKWITASVCLLIAGIVPYLGLTTFDFQYISTVADRYAYFGMVGVGIFIAALAVRSRWAVFAVLAVAPIWGVLTYRQIERWRNTSTLFSYTLEINPRSLVSHNIFGYLAAREHRPAEAESHYLAGLQVWPQDATILFNLGNLYLKDNPELAAQRYAQAVRYEPKFALYRNNFGVALARTNHAEQAYQQWRQAIADDPAYIDPHNNLADMLVDLNRMSEARREYQAVLMIDPANPHANAALMHFQSQPQKN